MDTRKVSDRSSLRKHKKGTLKEVKSAVLLVIVLLVIIALAFPVIRDTIKEILGYDVPEPPSPFYKPEDELNSIECSMKALSFAINQTNPIISHYDTFKDFRDQNPDYFNDCGCTESRECEPNEKKDNNCDNGKLYGNVCVDCQLHSGKYYCEVRGFFIPQTISDFEGSARKVVSDIWYQKKEGGPSVLAYFDQFPTREGASWIIPNSLLKPFSPWSKADFYKRERETLQADHHGNQELVAVDLLASMQGGMAKLKNARTYPLFYDYHSVNYPYYVVTNYYTTGDTGSNLHTIPWYAASPCKADLIVSSYSASCYVPLDDNNYYLFAPQGKSSEYSILYYETSKLKANRDKFEYDPWKTDFGATVYITELDPNENLFEGADMVPCYDPVFYPKAKENLVKPLFKTRAVSVMPILDTNEANNFCYTHNRFMLLAYDFLNSDYTAVQDTYNVDFLGNSWSFDVSVISEPLEFLNKFADKLGAYQSIAGTLFPQNSYWPETPPQPISKSEALTFEWNSVIE